MCLATNVKFTSSYFTINHLLTASAAVHPSVRISCVNPSLSLPLPPRPASEAFPAISQALCNRPARSGAPFNENPRETG